MFNQAEQAIKDELKETFGEYDIEKGERIETILVKIQIVGPTGITISVKQISHYINAKAFWDWYNKIPRGV